MSAIVVFRSGHAMPVAKMGNVSPVFTIRKSVDLVVRGCSAAKGGDLVVGLSTRTTVDSEHRMDVEGAPVGKKGERPFSVVGCTPDAFRISEEFEELVNSKKFAALEADVRDGAMKLVRLLAKWHGKYVAAIAGASEPVPATPVVSAEDLQERDPTYCERRFLRNVTKLHELLEENGVEEDSVSSPAEGIFALLALCAEKDVAVEDEHSMREALLELPIENIISPGTSPQHLPNFDDMVAAARGASGADDEDEEEGDKAA